MERTNYQVCYNSDQNNIIKEEKKEPFKGLEVTHALQFEYIEERRFREDPIISNERSFDVLMPGRQISHFEISQEINMGFTKEDIETIITQLKDIILEEKDLPSNVKNQCSICLNEFIKGEKVKQLDCGHYFHIKCIKEWMERKRNCPICRSIISKNK